MEMLVDGTQPSTIATNIDSYVALTFPNITIYELPSMSYFQHFCIVLQIIGETITAYRLAKANNWLTPKAYCMDLTSTSLSHIFDFSTSPNRLVW